MYIHAMFLLLLFFSTIIGKPSLSFVVKTMVVMVTSWLVAIAMAMIIALLLGSMGRSMSWFAHPLMIVPLYGVSSALVIGETNVQWMKWVGVVNMNGGCGSHRWVGI